MKFLFSVFVLLFTSLVNSLAVPQNMDETALHRRIVVGMSSSGGKNGQTTSPMYDKREEKRMVETNGFDGGNNRGTGSSLGPKGKREGGGTSDDDNNGPPSVPNPVSHH